MSQWEKNAIHAEKIYAVQVDWDERFYMCPECGEPIYECDWECWELKQYLCPVCEYIEDEE